MPCSTQCARNFLSAKKKYLLVVVLLLYTRRERVRTRFCLSDQCDFLFVRTPRDQINFFRPDFQLRYWKQFVGSTESALLSLNVFSSYNRGGGNGVMDLFLGGILLLLCCSVRIGTARPIVFRSMVVDFVEAKHKAEK